MSFDFEDGRAGLDIPDLDRLEIRNKTPTSGKFEARNKILNSFISRGAMLLRCAIRTREKFVKIGVDSWKRLFYSNARQLA